MLVTVDENVTGDGKNNQNYQIKFGVINIVVFPNFIF